MFIAAVIIIVVAAIVWFIWSFQSDQHNLDFWDSFVSYCPICQSRRRWGKETLYEWVATKTLEEIGKLELRCNNCKADLTGLYILHPFVKKALLGAATASKNKEVAVEYLKQLSVIDAAEPMAEERKITRRRERAK